MRSYEAARGLFSFLGFMSWAVIIIGALLAFSGGTIGGTGFGRNSGGMTALLGAAPGIILAMLGFYGLALVQMGRAGVDSAEYSQQSLEVARQQLEVSREVLDQGKKTAASYASLVASNPPRSKKKAKDPAHDSTEISYASKAKSKPKKEPPADVKAAHPKLEKQETKAVKQDPQKTLPEPPIELRLPDPKPEPVAVEKPERPAPRTATMPSRAPESNPVVQPKKPEPKKEPFVPKQIEEKDGVFFYGSTTFSSEAAAKRYVAQLGVNPNVKLPNA